MEDKDGKKKQPPKQNKKKQQKPNTWYINRKHYVTLWLNIQDQHETTTWRHTHSPSMNTANIVTEAQQLWL